METPREVDSGPPGRQKQKTEGADPPKAKEIFGTSREEDTCPKGGRGTDAHPTSSLGGGLRGKEGPLTGYPGRGNNAPPAASTMRKKKGK